MVCGISLTQLRVDYGLRLRFDYGISAVQCTCSKGPGSQKVIFFSNKLDLHILRNETRVGGKGFGEVWTLNSQNSLQELRCKLVFFSPSGEILYFRWISEL